MTPDVPPGKTARFAVSHIAWPAKGSNKCLMNLADSTHTMRFSPT